MTRREEIEQQASLTVFPWDDAIEQSKFEDGGRTMKDKWIKVSDRLPVPTDGDDFLVKTRALETNYAYAWYAYDRQCFMDYADGLSLANAITHWMPIELPEEE